MSTEAEQLGYDQEEWDTFPDETKDEVRGMAEVEHRFLEETRGADPERMYDIALNVTDDVMGEGYYAREHRNSPDPEIRAAVQRWEERRG